ncbi:fas-binding factor 1 homolog isoform X2 [Octopus bimaculoides]|uniref:fas-binding factor 1 homolog isoform X2 n=2 Tax=Octopus bimaculoides TaxID=37653 RepID=UPI00071DC64F|nr:fas-binding factor 1 homolog isoform X2 [Octopus bimaculoides]|eukprot:XP_014786827.1 PREDICTED: fas-binding factor 1 homolog isoform X2 [Octopus bimaculoides]
MRFQFMPQVSRMVTRPKTARRLLDNDKPKPSISEDFYANMAAVAEEESDLSLSDVDADQLAKSLADLDDMDADLFGGRKKDSDNKASQKSSLAGTSESHHPPSRDGSQDQEVTQQTKDEPPKTSSTLKNQESKFNDNIDLTGLLSDDDSLLQSMDKKEITTKLASDTTTTTTTTTKPGSTDAPPPPTKTTTLNPSPNTSSISKVKETKGPATKKAVTFNNEDDIFDELGLNDSPQENTQSSKSNLDYLFGRSSPTETFGTSKDKKSLVDDLLKGKHVTNSSEQGTNKEEDFIFGSYVPSAAASSTSLSTTRSGRLLDKGESKSSLLSDNSSKRRGSFLKTSLDNDDDDDDDDDDDTFDWLMGISKEKSSIKSSTSHKTKKTTKPKVEEKKSKEIVLDDDDDDDWLGIKKATTDTELNESFKTEISHPAKPSLTLKDVLPPKTETPGKVEKSKSDESFEFNVTPKTSAVRRKSSVVTKSEPTIQTSGGLEKSSALSKSEPFFSQHNTVQEKPEEITVKSPKLAAPSSAEPAVKPSQKPPHVTKEDQPKRRDSYNIYQTADNQNTSQDFKQQSMQVLTELNSPKPSLHIVPNVTKGPLDGSLDTLAEAEIKIHRLQIEKEHLTMLNETVQKRCNEEIKAVEQSYKSRFQLIEDTQQEREVRLRQENEELLKQNLEKICRLEDEKSALIQRHYAALAVFEKEKAAEIQQLREAHRLALQQERQDFTETINRVKEAKLQELEAINNFQSTNRSLNIVMEKMNTNAEELGQFQQKLDRWQNQGLDEREVSIRNRDEQLKMLQARLNRQQEENGRERLRLEALIERLECQLHSQTQLLEDEKWKVKQEVNKYQALQVSVEAEKRLWEEDQAREKAALDKCRNDLLEEQKRLMTQLVEERRTLAEEKIQAEVSQKLWKEREHQNIVKAAKIETEFDVTMKALSEENEKCATQKEILDTEQRMLEKEQKKLNKEKSLFEEEKSQVFKMAAEIRERSLQIESLYTNANRVKEEGELALTKSSKLDMEHKQRWKDLLKQMDLLTEREKELAEQQIKIHHERQGLEELRKSHLCLRCRVPMTETKLATQGLSTMAASLKTSEKLPSMFVPVQVSNTLQQTNFQDTLDSMVTDNWLTQWKIHSLKDQEFLFGENLYLATLERSQYLADYTFR